MAQIDPKYMMQEMQIKSHVIFNLSHDYESVIIKFRGEIADTPLEKIKKEITLHYDYLLKHKGRAQEVALTVSQPHFTKTSKVTCSYRGKLGHKVNECRFKAHNEKLKGESKAVEDHPNTFPTLPFLNVI
jgi:hypothetical protein